MRRSLAHAFRLGFISLVHGVGPMRGAAVNVRMAVAESFFTGGLPNWQRTCGAQKSRAVDKHREKPRKMPNSRFLEARRFEVFPRNQRASRDETLEFPRFRPSAGMGVAWTCPDLRRGARPSCAALRPSVPPNALPVGTAPLASPLRFGALASNPIVWRRRSRHGFRRNPAALVMDPA
jgi:hypothetical protein